MKYVIYKKTGTVNEKTKSFPALLFRSRERHRSILIGNNPVEVSDREYDALKNGKHGKEIALYVKKKVEITRGEKAPIKKDKKPIFKKNKSKKK